MNAATARAKKEKASLFDYYAILQILEARLAALEQLIEAMKQAQRLGVISDRRKRP